MAFRSSTGFTPGSGNSLAINVPAGAAAGDIAVVGIYKENDRAITPPTGFTEKVALATSATARGSLYVYWKRLTAADTGTYSFTWGGGGVWRSAACALFSGRSTSGDPFDGTVGTAESTTAVTSLNVSTSPAASGGDAVDFHTNFQGGNSYTAPTNYTERQDLDVIGMFTRDNVASGSTGNVTATYNVSGFAKAFLGVLAVASAGPSTVDLTPAVVTVAAIALDPVPQSVTVNLTPAVVTVTAVELSTGTPPSEVSLTPAVASLSAVALNPVPGAVTVALTPATASVTAVALDPEPLPVTVNLSPAVATVTAVPLDAEPGAVTVSLTPAVVTVTAVPLNPGVPTGDVNLTPATVQAVAVALNPVPGAATVELTPAAVQAVAVALDPEPGAVTVTLTPAVVTVTAVPVTFLGEFRNIEVAATLSTPRWTAAMTAQFVAAATPSIHWTAAMLTQAVAAATPGARWIAVLEED